MRPAQECEERLARLEGKHSTTRLVSSTSESFMQGHLAPCTELQMSVRTVLSARATAVRLSAPISVGKTARNWVNTAHDFNIFHVPDKLIWRKK